MAPASDLLHLLISLLIAYQSSFSRPISCWLFTFRPNYCWLVLWNQYVIVKVAPYSSTIVLAHRTKAQLIARSKENVSVFRFLWRQHEHKKRFLRWTFYKFGSVVTTYNSYKNPILWKSVRANLIYLEEWQITEYWKNRLNNFEFLPMQNVRQYHFHDLAKYEKISPKENLNI